MPTIDQLLADPTQSLADPIALVAAGGFRWGQCEAKLYDPTSPDFDQPFLYSLYERTRLSGQRHPRALNILDLGTLGALPILFCGSVNLGPDAICAYLSQRAVCVVGEWRSGEVTARLTDSENPQVEFDAGPERFHPLGYCFPSHPVTTSPLSLTGQPSNSLFAGYTFFSECWRTPAQHVLMYLGLAWLFSTFSLAAIHGTRYSDNHLTARWTRQFGFRDCGTLPYYMLREPGGPLVSATFAVLEREEFERRLRGVLEEVRKDSIPS